MAKSLKRRWNRGQKSLQLYETCVCSCVATPCQGCGSVPSNDYSTVYHSHNVYDSGKLAVSVRG